MFKIKITELKRKMLRNIQSRREGVVRQPIEENVTAKETKETPKQPEGKNRAKGGAKKEVRKIDLLPTSEVLHLYLKDTYLNKSSHRKLKEDA